MSNPDRALEKNDLGKNFRAGADKGAQWVKAFVAKSGNLSFIPWIHMMEEEDWLYLEGGGPMTTTHVWWHISVCIVEILDSYSNSG